MSRTKSNIGSVRAIKNWLPSFFCPHTSFLLFFISRCAQFRNFRSEGAAEFPPDPPSAAPERSVQDFCSKCVRATFRILHHSRTKVVGQEPVHGFESHWGTCSTIFYGGFVERIFSVENKKKSMEKNKDLVSG